MPLSESWLIVRGAERMVVEREIEPANGVGRRRDWKARVRDALAIGVPDEHRRRCPTAGIGERVGQRLSRFRVDEINRRELASGVRGTVRDVPPARPRPVRTDVLASGRRVHVDHDALGSRWPCHANEHGLRLGRTLFEIEEPLARNAWGYSLRGRRRQLGQAPRDLGAFAEGRNDTVDPRVLRLDELPNTWRGR